MNEDENGITPPEVTAMTISREDELWWVIIEQGNGDLLKDIKLTKMERMMLAGALHNANDHPLHISFVDLTR